MLECLVCETKFMRDRQYHGTMAAPGPVCFDCMASRVSGLSDVWRLVFFETGAVRCAVKVAAGWSCLLPDNTWAMASEREFAERTGIR